MDKVEVKARDTEKGALIVPRLGSTMKWSEDSAGLACLEFGAA